MEKVLLCYDDKPDYVFLIEDIEHINKAIEYKNNKLEVNTIGMSDFEYIIEYLNNNNIEYDYISLFDAKELEY
jgi:hypothetical protein